MRKTAEELNVIMHQNNVSKLWSWSKINTYHTSTYEYYLKYLLNKQEDRQDCIYAPVGGMCHDIIEKLYTNQIEYKDMDELFEDAWLTADISGLKFDRNDAEKNRNISAKYYKNLKHFFGNHIKIPYKVITEQFITIKIGNNLLQGYIDVLYKDNNGEYHILDWKTSTVYKNEKAINEAGQLTIYAIGLHQMGIPYEKIHIGWDFLKYVQVDCTQANGNITTREIERREIGSKLQTSVKMWLKKLGYTPEDYLDKFVFENDLSVLPRDVQDKFKIRDCIIEVPITDTLINKWTSDIIATIDEIEEKEKEYKKTFDEKIFYDTPENVQKQSYYFTTLSGYSINLNKPFKEHLERLEREKNGDLLKPKTSNNTETDDDLSWLDML